MWRPVFRSTHGPRRSGKFVVQGWRPSNVLSIFQFLTLGAYLWAKGHQKGRLPTIHPDLPYYKISARSRKLSTRYALRKFFTFWPRGANPWAKVHEKGRWPDGLRDLPSCKISSLYANPCPRYPLPKILQTHTQTNSKRYISSMPIGMWG